MKEEKEQNDGIEEIQVLKVYRLKDDTNLAAEAQLEEGLGNTMADIGEQFNSSCFNLVCEKILDESEVFIKFHNLKGTSGVFMSVNDEVRKIELTGELNLWFKVVNVIDNTETSDQIQQVGQKVQIEHMINACGETCLVSNWEGVKYLAKYQKDESRLVLMEKIELDIIQDFISL